MTNITEIHNSKDNLVGFEVSGHANYSIPGRDIVCAAVSMLTMNTINSIRELTCMEVNVVEDSKDSIRYFVHPKPGEISGALLRAARIGYKSLAEQYPDNVAYEERR